jgi:colicin import membrane protein
MRWLGLALMLLAVPVVASSAADAAAQRERIAREQAAVERDARAAQAACASQFAVTACVDGVRAERRRRLQALDRERAVLDDELRKRRAAERLEQIRQRQAARDSEPPKVTVRTRAPAASVAAPSAPSPTRSPEAALAARQAAAARADAEAAERAAAAARRASEAQAHRHAVEKRNQERARERKPAQPLPLPAASSAASQ